MSELNKRPKDRQFWRDTIYPPGETPNAYPNGSRVRKINAHEGDLIDNGSVGTVLSSHTVLYEELVPDGDKAYFVEWDWYSGWPTGVAGYQLELISRPE